MKRVISGFLILIMVISVMPFNIFANQVLTIDDVRTMSSENSIGVQDVIIDKIKKEIELQQAKEGIADIRKKESTVRFSLLFNIEFPEKHGLPKEIELIMKVPQIKNEISILEEQKPYEILKSQQEGESAFYDVILAEYNVEYLEERIEDSKQVLENINLQYKTGRGSINDVEYMEKQVNDFESQYQKSLLELDQKIKNLSGIIGKDVKVGYDFQEYLPEVNIERSQLENIIEFSKENDFELYKIIQARKLAETDTNEILAIYKNRYGGYINDIESYIKSHEGKKIDYEEFIKEYNHTLTEIDSPWAGNYVINLLFFKIYIPKEWFKGEYSGTRYMEDQKYALFVSLVERDKARQAEENAIKELESKIYTAYNTLKQLESSYESAEEALEIAKSSYDEKLLMNKRGLVDFTSLESSRNDYFTKQNNLYEMKIDYAKNLSSFNLTTSGYINHILSNGEFTSESLEAGQSVANLAQWYVDTSIASQTFTFGVKLPKDYDADQFQLYYQGKAIGEKVNIDSTLVHLPFTYEDTTLMEVRFYKNGNHVYTGTFDGGQYEGELLMKSVDNNKTNTDINTNSDILGSWSTKEIDLLRKELNVKANDLDYTEYEIFYKNTSIGKSQKDKLITTLAIYYSQMEDVTIKFYGENGNVISEGTMGSGSSSGNILLKKGV